MVFVDGAVNFLVVFLAVDVAFLAFRFFCCTFGVAFTVGAADTVVEFLAVLSIFSTTVASLTLSTWPVGLIALKVSNPIGGSNNIT